MHPAIDLPVLGSRLQVLADGKDISPVGGDVPDGALDFFQGFAQSKHDARFRRESLALRMTKHGTGAVVARLHAHRLLESLDGFEIVVVDVGSCLEHHVDQFEAPLEVWNKNFNGSLRIAVANGADGGCPDAGTAIGELIPGDACDDTVAESHLCHGIGDARGFAEIKFGRPAGLYRAKIAGSGADVSKDHHRRCSAGPAFTQVWTLCALANGVEFVVIHELAHGVVAGSTGQFGA